MPEVIPVQEINLSFFATADQQMGMRSAADRVREDHGAARAQVVVNGVERRLIKGREIVLCVKPAGGGNFYEAVAEAVGVQVWVISGESAIAGFEVKIAARIDRWALSTLPNP